MTRYLLAAAIALFPTLAQPQSDPMAVLRDTGLAAAVTATPETRPFLRGTLMTLRAVERSLQTGARHTGLATE
jgi:hypothetical protein